MNRLTEAAGGYLARGLSVIALTGKTPNVAIHKRGLHEPLAGAPEDQSDWDLLQGVFEHPDTTGVGIVIPYPYVVVDIDGEEGAVQWLDIVGDEWTNDFGTWSAKTPRKPAGGLHLWYACTTPTGSIKLGPNLDLKGQASYVAAPPSLHPDGGTYEWLLDPSEGFVREAPEALVKRIEYHLAQTQRAMVGKEQRRVRRMPRFAEGDKVFYAQLGWESLYDGMASAGEGNRNNYLHWAAATLSEEGGIDEDFERLEEVALAAGLERVEVRRTIRSARKLHG